MGDNHLEEIPARHQEQLELNGPTSRCDRPVLTLKSSPAQRHPMEHITANASMMASAIIARTLIEGSMQLALWTECCDKSMPPSRFDFAVWSTSTPLWPEYGLTHLPARSRPPDELPGRPTLHLPWNSPATARPRWQPDMKMRCSTKSSQKWQERLGTRKASRTDGSGRRSEVKGRGSLLFESPPEKLPSVISKNRSNTLHRIAFYGMALCRMTWIEG